MDNAFYHLNDETHLHQMVFEGATNEIDTTNNDYTRYLLEAIPYPAAIINKTGKIIFANLFFFNLFGFNTKDLLGKPLEYVVPAKSRKQLKNQRLQFSQSKSQQTALGKQNIKTIGYASDKTEFPIEVDLSTIPFSSSGYILVTVRDVNFYKYSQQISAKCSRQLSLIIALSKKTIASKELDEIYALSHEIANNLLPIETFYISLVDEEKQILNYAYFFDKGKQYSQLTEPMAKASLAMFVIRNQKTLFIPNDTGHSKNIGTELYGAEDDTRSVIVAPLKDDTGQVIGAVSSQHYTANVYSDENVKLMELLAEHVTLAIIKTRLHTSLLDEATRDPLTNLYNRKFMIESVNKEIQQAKRANRSFALVAIDLDHFKNINDKYGHQIGDDVVVSLSKILTSSIRGGDVACRYGGDEFLLLLSDINLDTAVNKVSSIKEKIKNIQIATAPQVAVSCSIGIATFPLHGKTFESLFESADKALYISKINGRDKISVP